MHARLSVDTVLSAVLCYMHVELHKVAQRCLTCTAGPGATNASYKHEFHENIQSIQPSVFDAGHTPAKSTITLNFAVGILHG